VVKDCLTKASKANKASILFSAIGCGQLKYPPEVVANVMFETSLEFDKNNKKSTLKTVQFVVFPQDEPVRKVCFVDALERFEL